MNTQSSLSLLRRLGTTATRIYRSAPAARPSPRVFSTAQARPLRITSLLNDKSDPYHKASTEATGTSAGPHEGSASRTDREIIVEYPEDEKEFDRHERPLRGFGGVQNVRTLPTFSLEGRTAVVTGGARGLGLVMGQALVNSGADLAIVDLNSACAPAGAHLAFYICDDADIPNRGGR